MTETKADKFGDAFHAHLDACPRCAHHPFDLCLTGAALLRSSVTETSVRACHPGECGVGCTCQCRECR